MRFVSRAGLLTVFTCMLALAMAVTPETARAELTAEEVRVRLRRGVRYLKEHQEANGSWSLTGEYANYGEGKTALCTLALLHAGVSPRDDTIVNAMRKLAEVERDEQFTYSVSLQIMVLCLIDAEKYRPQLLQLVGWLEKAQVKEGGRVGGWPYTLSPQRRQVDNSNSQYALLALHEAAQAGVPVNDQVWGRALNYWKKGQNEETGAFGYMNDDNVSGTMVCAGISSLIIAHENFQASIAVEGVVDGDTVRCCGQKASKESVQQRVDRAMKWLSERFSISRVPGSELSLGFNYQFYYLYGLERAGRLAGVRFFGKHDWYREGADFLVKTQKASGAWSGRGVENDESIATAFALLFLAKGRRPIVMAKYRHGTDNDWDRHRKGVHYLTNAVERSWKRDLNWQTINGNNADVNDLLESPVMFISGSKRLELTADQKNALREYVNQGGFVFAETCDGEGCDGSEFDRSFRELLSELFPNSPLQAVSADHPLWFSDQPINPSARRPLLGMQACCRTSIVYCPRNLSCYWSLHRNRSRVRGGFSETVQQEIEYCVQLGVNVLAYATHRNLRDKLDRRKIATVDDSSVNRREEITIAKLRHDGGADDAPVALPNLLQSARTETGQAFVQRPDLLSPESKQLPSNPFLFAHGRQSFEFTEEQRAELRKSLIDRRFFLFGDAICGSEAFAESFRRELAEILPEYPLAPLPPDHPLLSDDFGGFQIDSVTLREPFRNRETQRQEVRQNRIVPALEAIVIDGRIAVVFSKYDLSCALENSGTVECPGYSTEDATRLGINILLYALQN